MKLKAVPKENFQGSIDTRKNELKRVLDLRETVLKWKMRNV